MKGILQKPIFLSLLSGILLWLSWPTAPTTILIFGAWIPLLFLAEKPLSRAAFAGYAFLSLWIWNTGTTWWVGNTTVPASGIFANAFTALLMTFPWLAYKKYQDVFGTRFRYVALVLSWMCYEWVHSHWELAWPWLTLGNVFATRPEWIQWYQFTGVNGGTLWVWMVNLLIFQHLLKWKDLSIKKIPLIQINQASWKLLALIVLPIILSAICKNKLDKEALEVEVVVVQPNIDPYQEKFEGQSMDEQFQTLLKWTQNLITDQTEFVLWPETALFPTGVWEHELVNHPQILDLQVFLRKYPKAKIITGATTIKEYLQQPYPNTARQRSNGLPPYDVFNSTLQIASSGPVGIYHKVKLVPGVEITPYMRYLPFMKKIALNFGGITGTYGLTPADSLFVNPPTKNVFAAICYESVFGDFVASKVKDGANWLAICTNDGWWGQTQGHLQHLHYARLRAIESNRYVVRSANTGISAIIDPNGRILQQTSYWEEDAFRARIQTQISQTFYVRYQQIITWLPLIASLIFLLYTVLYFKK